jgi:hypothetical protein
MSKPDPINVEAILDDLHDSEINVAISWLWDGGIDVKLGGIKVKLGDELNGYKAEGKVSSMAEAAVWLRDKACQQYPDSGFARKYGGFV